MSEREVNFGNRMVGDGHPVFVVAELGINHNGDTEIAKRLIDVAVNAGVDAVKFQKRTPGVSVPESQKGQMRETPWGYITYLEYRQKTEFNESQYKEIADYCKDKGISWFASVWDKPSVDFMEGFETLAYKIPSAALTDHELISHARSTGKPLILTTGMSTMDQIREGVAIAGRDNLILVHCTSTYPCDPRELNLRMIETLKKEFPEVPVGYAGHEIGLVSSAVSVAFGACMVERHITLDRAMWGSDQAASLEPGGLEKLVRYIKITEMSLGDGEKKVYDSELPTMYRQRRNN